MSATDKKRLAKLYQRADEETKAKVREILGGEPSERILKEAPSEKIGQALMLLQGLRGPAQTPSKENFAVQAFWDGQFAKFRGKPLDVFLERVRYYTRAENVGNERGVSSSVEESKWEVYCLFVAWLKLKKFDPVVAELCGLTKEEHDLRVKMFTLKVKSKEELEKVEAFVAFVARLSPANQALLEKLIKAIEDEPRGRWWVLLDLSDNGVFLRAHWLAGELVRLGIMEEKRFSPRKRF